MKHLAFAAAAFTALGVWSVFAPAMAAPPATGACLEPARLYRWNVEDDRNLIVTDKNNHKYKVALKPGCYDLKFTNFIDFKPFLASRLDCLGAEDAVVVPAQLGTPRQYCRIDSVIAYTPDMEKADAVNKAMDKPH